MTKRIIEVNVSWISILVVIVLIYTTLKSICSIWFVKESVSLYTYFESALYADKQKKLYNRYFLVYFKNGYSYADKHLAK